jgi:formate hydrogenlyase subunit 3/multisubunit Na+/H+ antiporter MnhD subunit
MSAPLLLVIASILTAFLAFLVRNQRAASAFISASGAFLIAVFVLFAPFDKAFEILGVSLRFESKWIVLGRALNLETSIRPMIGFLYLCGLYFFSGSWIIVLNRFFPSVATLMLITVASSIMVEPFLFAAAFIGLAAMGSVLMLVSQMTPQSVGAVRLMVLYTFAMLAILLSGWMIETGSGTGTAFHDGVRAATVLSFGFAILMAIPPFHIWLTAGAQESNPFILAFVTVILQGAGFFFLLRFIDAYGWLRDDAIFTSGLQVISAGTMLLSGLWALSARDLRRVFAYTIVADMGVILLALSNNNPGGARIALALFGARVFGIAVLALGLSIVRPDGTTWRGVGRKYPLAALAILVGLLSLAGFPLTAGFPGRWALLSLTFGQRASILVTLLTTMILFALLVLRWATILFDPGIKFEREPGTLAQQFYLLIGTIGLLLLGIAPQVLAPWVVEVASGLVNLFP